MPHGVERIVHELHRHGQVVRMERGRAGVAIAEGYGENSTPKQRLNQAGELVVALLTQPRRAAHRHLTLPLEPPVRLAPAARGPTR